MFIGRAFLRYSTTYSLGLYYAGDVSYGFKIHYSGREEKSLHILSARPQKKVIFEKTQEAFVLGKFHKKFWMLEFGTKSDKNPWVTG